MDCKILHLRKKILIVGPGPFSQSKHRGKKYKWAELMGSAHINTELDRAESCATSDCHAGCLRVLGRLLVTKTPQ